MWSLLGPDYWGFGGVQSPRLLRPFHRDKDSRSRGGGPVRARPAFIKRCHPLMTNQPQRKTAVTSPRPPLLIVREVFAALWKKKKKKKKGPAALSQVLHATVFTMGDCLCLSRVSLIEKVILHRCWGVTLMLHGEEIYASRFFFFFFAWYFP